MKRSFKYSLLITLTLLIITSLVNAQTVDIGKSDQNRPYESNPTVTLPTQIVGVTFGAESDGSLTSVVAFQGYTPYDEGIVNLQSFTTPPLAQQFTIGWVDIKIKYQHPGIGDDNYTISYKTSGTVYNTLQATVVGAAAKFDDTAIAAVRPWVNVTPTGGGAWTWTDVQNLDIKISVGRGVNAVWDSLFSLYEVWVTIYELAPPSSSTAMSVMPGVSNTTITGVVPGKYFFVDVYLNGLSGGSGQLWGYQAHIKYDESVVTATSYITYYPFTVLSAASIGSGGNVSVSYTMQSGDLVGFTGTATPLCRIYFRVDSLGGATYLDLIDDRPEYITEFTDPFGSFTTPPLYDGWFSSPRYLSAEPPVLIDLANPIGTMWHEFFPDYCKTWTLTSWEDVSPDNPLELGPSDQIDMKNETGWTYWFHVDEVTITIHYTFKDELGEPIPGEIGKAEPEVPMTTMFDGSPIGSKWHVIYPTFSDTFEISSWEDTDGSTDFTPSDQFDFSSGGVGDVVLVGPAPPPGAPLSWALLASNQPITFADVNTNGVWDVGEAVVQDAAAPAGFYYTGDIVLTGPVPPIFTALVTPAPTDMHYDANTNGAWDVGEPAIRDVNANQQYDEVPTFWAHLDNVTTDIIISQKPIPPKPPEEPEFPLGISLLLLIAPIIPLTYLWRLRKKVTKR